MKIRIRGNSIRFRLTRPEVETLCTKGSVTESTSFADNQFVYSVELSEYYDQLSAIFADNTITLYLPANISLDWHKNEVVGFENQLVLANGESLHLLVEKDFTCLVDRGEDESDNYRNPKSLN